MLAGAILMATMATKPPNNSMLIGDAPIAEVTSPYVVIAPGWPFIRFETDLTIKGILDGKDLHIKKGDYKIEWGKP